MGIESVVPENNHRASGGFHDAMCSTCEMAVVWMQNQLKQNQTQERILNYVNEVKYHISIHYICILNHINELKCLISIHYTLVRFNLC